MIDIYVLDGTRVRTNGSLIAIAEDPEIENVFQLNPGKVRIRHYSFRKESNHELHRLREKKRQSLLHLHHRSRFVLPEVQGKDIGKVLREVWQEGWLLRELAE